MANKKRKSDRGNKSHGHFCKVCGEHKANEKFSGKGHALHICKACAALPVEQRNEMMTIRKIENMAFRHLNENEINWLRSHMKDARPEVRDAAIQAHRTKFPHYERNMVKKGLTAFSLELYVHDTLFDDWGDEVDVHARVFAERSGLFRYADCASGQETEAHVELKEAKRFLKSVVQQMEAPFWNEDYSDEKYRIDPYLDVLPEYRPNDDDYDMDDEYDEADEEEGEQESAPPENREPLCSLCLELNNGEDKEMVFYNSTPDAAAELFWLLMEYFEPDGNKLDEYDD